MPTLKALREAAGFATQEALAEKVGMRQGAVSQLERGRVPNPTSGTLQKLAAALGCSLEQVIDAIEASVRDAA
jgi:transcriptional regulator with XRE-family HTH domain